MFTVKQVSMIHSQLNKYMVFNLESINGVPKQDLLPWTIFIDTSSTSCINEYNLQKLYKYYKDMDYEHLFMTF